MITKSTLISLGELHKRIRAEGLDPQKVNVISPRWAESGPLRPGVKSALISCDLIIRSDNSAVYLDGAMSIDLMQLAAAHINGEDNPP